MAVETTSNSTRPPSLNRRSRPRPRPQSEEPNHAPHRPRFGGAFCCPRRLAACCGRKRNEELDQTLFRFANFSAVGPLDFEGIAATSQVCPQDGYALDIRGGDISRFSDGKGALLLEHDKYQIVGTCGLRKTARRVMMNGRFTSPGVSETADQARR